MDLGQSYLHFDPSTFKAGHRRASICTGDDTESKTCLWTIRISSTIGSWRDGGKRTNCLRRSSRLEGSQPIKWLYILTMDQRTASRHHILIRKLDLEVRWSIFRYSCLWLRLQWLGGCWSRSLTGSLGSRRIGSWLGGGGSCKDKIPTNWRRMYIDNNDPDL